jgi:hypothetical protein
MQAYKIKKILHAAQPPPEKYSTGALFSADSARVAKQKALHFCHTP